MKTKIIESLGVGLVVGALLFLVTGSIEASVAIGLFGMAFAFVYLSASARAKEEKTTDPRLVELQASAKEIGGIIKVITLTEGEKTEKIIALKFLGENGSYKKGQAWGKSNNLLQSTKDTLDAIMEQYQNLNEILGVEKICLVETTGCSLCGDSYAYYQCWHGCKRDSSITLQSNFGLRFHWAIFRSPEALDA